MFGSTKGRLLTILVVSVLAIATLIAQPIKFGLDLQGGTYLTLEVDDPRGTMTDEMKAAAIDQNLEILRQRISGIGVGEEVIQKAGDLRIVVQLPGVDEPERAKANITKPAVLDWRLVRPTAEFASSISRIDRAAALVKLDSLTPAGTEGDSASAGPDSAALSRQALQDQLFGNANDTAADTTAADTANLAPKDRPFSSLLGQAGDGEFYVREQDVPKIKAYLEDPGVRAALPRGSTMLWGADTIAQGADLFRSLYVVTEKPFVTGTELVNATAGREQQLGKTIVSFQLSRAGGRDFDEATSQNIGKRIAIVLDERVFSAPVVQGRISTNGQIEMGNSPLEEARDLALVLNAGAFSAPLKFMEQRTVAATLGTDSVTQGKWAGILGLLLVVSIMVVVYRLAGIFSIVALIVYCLIVLGGLSAMHAALTAPGIAGFILSIGMAVDANVLIFERIREELLHGRSVRLSVDEGFKHAMTAIIDTHITTLITAFILYKFGTGPIQGFAVTLAVGLIASFFSAVFVTRTLFLVYMERRRGAETISI